LLVISVVARDLLGGQLQKGVRMRKMRLVHRWEQVGKGTQQLFLNHPLWL
jgi:hypothetical protein